MKCPHCRVEVHQAFGVSAIGDKPIGKDRKGGTWMFFAASYMTCPACEQAIIYIRNQYPNTPHSRTTMLAYPQHRSERAPAAEEVPEDIAEDFNEASQVLADSAKASAALSRRCLQAVLRSQGFTQHDLSKQIDAVLGAKQLPSGLAANVDAIRNTGNFAAHPLKDTNSGAILPVEPHEAEWNLEVLEGLFDFFYVAPARDAARRAALDAKLAAAGKPPMKT